MKKRNGGQNRMKAYIIIAHNGTEVIDNTYEAEFRIATMDYMEERHKRECERLSRKSSRFKKFVARIACFCAII